LAAGPAVASVARAQTDIRVRATTRLELRSEPGGDAIHLAGRLLDDADSPIGAQTVVVLALASGGASLASTPVATDAAGAFRVTFQAIPDLHTFVAQYAGDGLHDASEQVLPHDATRAPVRIEWILPDGSRLDLDRPRHPVEVRVRSTAGAGQVAVEVRDELDRVLARGRTNADGNLPMVLTRSDLGAPGTGLLSARTEGDAARAEGRADVTVLRSRGSRIEAAARPAEGALLVEGTLRDSRGGLGRQPVGLFASNVHLETRWTDASGRFAFQLPSIPERTSAHETELEVRFDSDAPWIGSSKSEILRIAPREAWPGRGWILTSFALTLLLLAATRRRAPSGPTRTAHRAPGAHASGPARIFGRRSRRVGGMITDASDGRPLADARVAIQGSTPGTRSAVPVDWLGRFSSAPLSGGTWTLLVEADGYESARASIPIPHRGEWREAHVRLQSLRASAEHRYRTAASAVLPEPHLWYYWSERETVAHRRAHGHATTELTTLVDLVERARYGPTAPRAEALEAIDRGATAAIAEARAASWRETDRR
jgi:hypothetical protein